MTPALRRHLALVTVGLSLVAWLVVRVLYATGHLSHGALDAITNDLSFLAITLTAIDVLSTSDVRVQQESDDPPAP